MTKEELIEKYENISDHSQFFDRERVFADIVEDLKHLTEETTTKDVLLYEAWLIEWERRVKEIKD